MTITREMEKKQSTDNEKKKKQTWLKESNTSGREVRRKDSGGC